MQRYFWQHGLEKQIEETFNVTNTCQESVKSLGSISPASRSLPGAPWKRLHVDLCSQLWSGYLFKIL